MSEIGFIYDELRILDIFYFQYRCIIRFKKRYKIFFMAYNLTVQ